jgi:hypothetical protein
MSEQDSDKRVDGGNDIEGRERAGCGEYCEFNLSVCRDPSVSSREGHIDIVEPAYKGYASA